LFASAGTKTVTNGIVPNSNAVQFNQAGTFYWQAVYSGDFNNNSATSTCTSEVVTISPNGPSITTTLSATTGAIGDTVHDSSTLTGATANAGGTVTYTVYTDNTCDTFFADAGTKTVTNGVPADSDGVQFNQAGSFFWQAVYSGDANNTGATSTCTDEKLIISPNGPSITTTLSATTGAIGDTVHDSSTLTGATANAGGTVTYTVYSDNTCTTSVASAGTKTVTNGVVPDSDAVTFNAAGSFFWQAVYSGDANNTGATSTCTDEKLIISPNGPSISTTLSATEINVGGSVSDSATLTGATSDAGGTVTYTVYNDNACTTSVASAGTKTVTNGVVPDSDAVTFNTAGDFFWQAVYSGDANNSGATSTCTEEHLVVKKPVKSQITPTATTCAQFRDGTAGTLSELLYTVKSGSINSVAPGVFFYWISVDAVQGSNTFVIHQNITTGNFDSHFFNMASGSAVFTSNCVKLTGTNSNITQAGADTTVTFNASSAGTYIIGIKYDSASVKGFAPPSGGTGGTTAHYEFSTGGTGIQGIDLKPKP
jgi:hypothetical protein